MPALQSLVITDRTATPVNFTLLPVKEDGGVGTVAVSDSTGTMISEKRFSISSRRSNGRIKSTLKFRNPTVVIEIINGVTVPKVSREAFVDCTFTFSESSTETERNDVVGMFASALLSSKALIHDTVVKGQSVW